MISVAHHSIVIDGSAAAWILFVGLPTNIKVDEKFIFINMNYTVPWLCLRVDFGEW